MLPLPELRSLFREEYGQRWQTLAVVLCYPQSQIKQDALSLNPKSLEMAVRSTQRDSRDLDMIANCQAHTTAPQPQRP